MVLGVLTAVGVTFIVGYVTRALTANANQVNEDDQQRNRIDQIQHRLKELEKERSGSGCCYFLILFMLLTFLTTLGIILNVTNFFRSQKKLTTLIFDWNYWLNYEYKIFDYNYSGIAGVAVTMVVVVFPLLFIVCKLCWDMRKQENEHRELRDELQQIEQDQRNRGGIAYAQGGLISIAIDRINCLNVHCSCYVTIVTSATTLAFVSVVSFTCYVLYTYLYK